MHQLKNDFATATFLSTVALETFYARDTVWADSCLRCGGAPGARSVRPAPRAGGGATNARPSKAPRASWSKFPAPPRPEGALCVGATGRTRTGIMTAQEQIAVAGRQIAPLAGCGGNRW